MQCLPAMRRLLGRTIPDDPFDLQRMLLHEFPLMFVAEVALRALLAFIAVFVFLKVSGRRGIRQLSVFELVIILTLGSAAGDVSFTTMFRCCRLRPYSPRCWRCTA